MKNEGDDIDRCFVLLVIQQYSFDNDADDDFERVLQLVQRVEYVMIDFLEVDMDRVHQYTMKDLMKEE